MMATNQIPALCAAGEVHSSDQEEHQQANSDQYLEQSIVSQRQKSAAHSGNFELQDGLLRRFDGKLVPEVT